MKIDLKSLSSKELEKLVADAKKALANARARDRAKARKAAEKAAAEYGFSLNELSSEIKGASKPRKAKAKAPAKKGKPQYANPEDATQTWTGKGRQPNWYRAAVESGIAPETMRIGS
ncbi:H-NS histone family protein [Sulfitobacter sp. M368]|uniref:H-NS histone family protein n=1 Tax=Sulfitobacter sp. M368 TaxID=2867021 RepID=UPI0021A97192|nr:H-NS histone family protein [Sulfitobacter sp. M368]UWR14517.1 H-NS histone family protein [Sulfitobacter sp. M368]